MQFAPFREERLMRFNMSFVGNAAINRANFGTLLGGERTGAFGAFCRIYDIDIFSFRDRGVRAFRLARAAADAFIGDFESHVFVYPPKSIYLL
jgi:hypothetical protein